MWKVNYLKVNVITKCVDRRNGISSRLWSSEGVKFLSLKEICIAYIPHTKKTRRWNIPTKMKVSHGKYVSVCKMFCMHKIRLCHPDASAGNLWKRKHSVTTYVFYITIFDDDGGGGGIKNHVHNTFTPHIHTVQYKIECNIFNHNWITCASSSYHPSKIDVCKLHI